MSIESLSDLKRSVSSGSASILFWFSAFRYFVFFFFSFSVSRSATISSKVIFSGNLEIWKGSVSQFVLEESEADD